VDAGRGKTCGRRPEAETEKDGGASESNYKDCSAEASHKDKGEALVILFCFFGHLYRVACHSR